ncbi:hypothetical protein VE04_07785 [Pseudogymnoascus sp. 24MN13]|nr:hypothetical protein VE04_07785 [Pseudogymnoascus sp. 24MN13]
MDVGLVRSRIVATLDADADARRRAERDLKAAEEHAGFTDALLDILQGEQEASVRLSTAVYLKNRVSRAWAVSDDAAVTHKPIPEEEKARVRERLLAAAVDIHGRRARTARARPAEDPAL